LGSCSLFSDALAVALVAALAVCAGIGSAAVFGLATAGLLAVATGAGSATAGVLAVATGVVSAMARLLPAATGVESTATGVLAVAVVVPDAGAVLAVGVAQWSEIIFTPVTATLLSEGPELVAIVFCPATAMS
jgi:hypothetical protein